jgi:hypothetical protein
MQASYQITCQGKSQLLADAVRGKLPPGGDARNASHHTTGPL